MTTRASASSGPSSPLVLILFGSWLVLYFAVRLYVESHQSMPAGIRLGLAFVPTPIFAAFLWNFIKGLRLADELERRIQLEALAIAFPLGLLLLTTLGLVQRAVELKFQDWSYNHVWPIVVMFYLLGVVVARKRYL